MLFSVSYFWFLKFRELFQMLKIGFFFQYWSDFKNKLKNKLLERKKRKPGSVKKDARPFTKLEKQALAILGPMFEKKHAGHNVQETTPCVSIPQLLNNINTEFWLEDF